MFWCHVFKAYKEFGKNIRLENSEELVAEPVFCNGNIRVGNRTVFQKSWIDNRVCHVKHILNENGTFMSFQSFREKYRINTKYITYIEYVHAIESSIRQTGLTVEGNGSVDLIKTVSYTHLRAHET